MIMSVMVTDIGNWSPLNQTNSYFLKRHDIIQLNSSSGHSSVWLRRIVLVANAGVIRIDGALEALK